MVEETNSEKPVETSNERAVAWSRQMMARKRATQKRMKEEFDSNPKAQALVNELFQRNNSITKL